jgi:ubiquinone biosynthesis protein COQ9
MLLGASPQHFKLTFEALWKLSDDIWFYAGDLSNDVFLLIFSITIIPKESV